MRRCRVVAAAVLAVLAGCGSPMPPTPGDAVFTVAAGAPVCADRPGIDGVLSPRTQALRTPLGTAEPTLFVRCTNRTERLPGRGEWSVRFEERADGDIAALATALRLPDEDAGGACDAMAIGVPELYGVDATGRALLVRWPTGACGRLRPEVDAALTMLPWRPTVRRQLKQVRSQASIDSGCEEGWKDMAAVEDRRPDRAVGGGSTALPAPRRVWACTYAIDEPETPQGHWVSGGRAGPAVWRALVLALRSAPPAPPGCTTQGTRFTVVLTGAEPLYVERDGCRRVLLPDGGLRIATPAVLAALAA